MAEPLLATTREELRTGLGKLGGLALVPTMGALHGGHRALLARAREAADSVAVSIFVNPLQFAPHEDFGRYPRTLEADLAVCAAEGVDLVFAPGQEVMYPREQLVRIDSGPMGRVLEGEFRPGFFDGVLTVVLKLLHLFQPQAVVFGEKDAQQLALVRRLVLDLDLQVTVEAVPTVRDTDGLAISSRNRYLTERDRRSALSLSRALRTGQDMQAAGPREVERVAGAVLTAAAAGDPPVDLDYLALVDPATFAPVADDYTGPGLLLVAAKVGGTRLIDNLPLTLGAGAP